MNDSEKAYKKVSGVDIQEQKNIWDERGKGYYGEYLVFNHLYGEIPGMSKILMNCEIPVEGNKKTEIDLILVHETGIYSFEMKHYKGDIYGDIDGEIWTQYFRTQSNEVFHNPVQQNAYHISALKDRFPSVPVYSFVVFTNEECTLRINGSVQDRYSFKDGILCTISCLPECFRSFVSYKETYLSPEEIDQVFNSLKVYSKLQNAVVKKEGEPLGILEYFSQFNQAFKDKVQQTKDDYEEKKEQLEQKTFETITAYKKRTVRNRILTVIAVLVCVAGTVILPLARINKAEKRSSEAIANIEEKYRSFFEKFEDANEVIAESVVTSDLVKVTDLSISDVSGVEDCVSVSFNLVGVDGDFALGLTADSRMIIRFTNGDIKEVDYYGQQGSILRESAWLYRFGNGGFDTITFDKIIVTDIRNREIENIKLNNIAVYKLPYTGNPILSDVEIEVYTKS